MQFVSGWMDNGMFYAMTAAGVIYRLDTGSMTWNPLFPAS